jgi:hypothetical protein
MGTKLPLLKPREVQTTLRALDFKYKRTDGSHETWERLPDAILSERKVVQVDIGKRQFDKFLMKMMIRQSGFRPHEFCTGTMDADRTASKAPAVVNSITPAPRIPVVAPATKKSN